MSTRRSQGKARTELPRSSEVAAAGAHADRSAGRSANGRFAPVHGLSFTKGWDSFFAETLGRDLEDGAGELGRKSWRLYRGFLSELPCISVGVRSLVAQRARAATLADFYAALAARGGPHTDKGTAWLGEAARWDARAERLAVTTWDLSTRAAKAARKLRAPTSPSSAIEAELARMERAELVQSTAADLPSARSAGDTSPAGAADLSTTAATPGEP